jgi:cytochrome c peroxidase
MINSAIKRHKQLSTGVTLLMFLLLACSKGKMNKAPEPFPLKVPSNFPQPVYDLASNPITKEGFELGRKLFYDGILSADGSTSCGSCHASANAFTHHGHNVSHGIHDRLGKRNSQPVMNLAWNNSFFWDGGVFNLDLQPIAPIENPVEMDEKLPAVINKLNGHPLYPALFEKAFGSSKVTSANMLKAISQFMLQCVSANSRYDKYVRKEGGVLTADELQGLAIFQAKCGSCHATDLFTDNQFHNTGLKPSRVNDSGRYLITLQETDLYKFKTPSLRNVALTPPYMHDGRFLNLEAALDHYSHEVQPGATLDPLLIQNGKPGIAMNADEKKKIILFLHTLSDESFVRNKMLAEP